MTTFDLQPVFDNMIEISPSDFFKNTLDDGNYIKLGLSIKTQKGLAIKKERAFELMEFLQKELSSWQPPITNSFIRKTTMDFLMKAYSENPKERKVEELLDIFKLLKRKKVNIYVKVFNLQTDIEKYDGGSFVLFHPDYFIKAYNNRFMYSRLDHGNANQDTIAHVGLVFKDVEILQEDKDYVKAIIQEKIEEFISAMGIALGNKDSAQTLSTNFNHIGTEYHLLNNDMIELSSSFSSDGSTFTKGSIDLKTDLFFSNHGNIFNILHKRDNQLKEKVHKSILWLGKSLQTENVGDSFLQVAIALECLLTKQTKGYYINASITYSISEALSFLIGNTKDERLEHFKEIKNLYGLRSAIVHSGKSRISIKEYYEFFHRVRSGIYRILDLMEEHNFKSIEELYDYIDELKFS